MSLNGTLKVVTKPIDFGQVGIGETKTESVEIINEPTVDNGWSGNEKDLHDISGDESNFDIDKLALPKTLVGGWDISALSEDDILYNTIQGGICPNSGYIKVGAIQANGNLLVNIESANKIVGLGDGSSSYAECNINAIDTETLECEFQYKDGTNVIVGADRILVPEDGRLYILTYNNLVYFGLGNVSPTGSVSLVDGQNYKVTLTYNNTTKAYSTTINGIADVSGVYTGEVNIGAELAIGQEGTTGGMNSNCKMWNIKIGTRAFYTLGGDVLDTSGNGNDGTNHDIDFVIL